MSYYLLHYVLKDFVIILIPILLVSITSIDGYCKDRCYANIIVSEFQLYMVYRFPSPISSCAK